MVEKLVQLEDKKTDINEGWFEDILHEFPCLKFALGYAKINSSRLSVSDWLIHARVKLDVDLARGYFPIRHSLSDMECTGAIEFLAVLAYPLPIDREKRVKFILANMAGVSRCNHSTFSSRARLSLNRQGWKLTSIDKIEYATNNGAERITKRLMHAHAVEQYLKEQTLFAEDNPRTFAQALYTVMDLYTNERIKNVSNPDYTKSNQRKDYHQSIPVIHYAMAYWQVLASEGKNPQNYYEAIMNPEWLPKVLTYGNNFLATQLESSRMDDLERGDNLYKFNSDKKVFIYQ